ncbi:hypothetical protein D8B26_006713 [Coccidioides posadasii str. Silveira]|uniref:Predicted protein n=1 Tax=Coccidioides posadasii (strain RMSCC 757 / Silveira) TaxID=443226 RepID=E9CR75_COCPS|nr:predicted protein [Coccidioides posadasii str. Silveira]QVM12077.1 hypothetical protein D8B26_006713 [Coccidioides posadasii str. Silveira]
MASATRYADGRESDGAGDSGCGGMEGPGVTRRYIPTMHYLTEVQYLDATPQLQPAGDKKKQFCATDVFFK